MVVGQRFLERGNSVEDGFEVRRQSFNQHRRLSAMPGGEPDLVDLAEDAVDGLDGRHDEHGNVERLQTGDDLVDVVRDQHEVGFVGDDRLDVGGSPR